MVKLLRAADTTGAAPVRVPRNLEASMTKAVKSATLDAYVGSSDRIVRRLQVALDANIPSALLERGETPHWRVTLDARLSRVNQPQRIAAPRKVSSRPARDMGTADANGARGLFLGAAILIDPPTGLAQTTTNLLTLTRQGGSRSSARAFARAVREKRKVVLFLDQRGGVEDPVTAASVAALEKRTKAAVFSDHIENLAAYGAVVSAAGVTRAPSILIIGKEPPGPPHRGLHRPRLPRPGSRRHAMSAESGVPPPLHAVPASGRQARPWRSLVAVSNGLTPPEQRQGSRFISDVIVEMGFVDRASGWRPRWPRARPSGARPSRSWSRRARSTATSSRARPLSASGFTTPT